MSFGCSVRGLAFALLFLAASTPAHGECLGIRYPDAIRHLKASRSVFLARVVATSTASGQSGVDFTVVRTWKGKPDRRWYASPGIVGEYYLVYEDPWQGLTFNLECSYFPIPLPEAAADITVLDKYRGFPRLVVPSKRK